MIFKRFLAFTFLAVPIISIRACQMPQSLTTLEDLRKRLTQEQRTAKKYADAADKAIFAAQRAAETFNVAHARAALAKVDEKTTARYEEIEKATSNKASELYKVAFDAETLAEKAAAIAQETGLLIAPFSKSES